jgi:hypothetical protein
MYTSAFGPPGHMGSLSRKEREGAEGFKKLLMVEKNDW